MKLPKASYNWALKHLINEGDTDLFPRPFEVDALRKTWTTVLKELEKLDIENYQWSSGRRFVVPKDNLAFRIATQLDPVDSLVLAAIIRKYGSRLENHRVPTKEQKVFSYRFAPTTNGRFYSGAIGWHDFWKCSLQKAKKYNREFVVITDISDFYNQIYHHVLENQLAECLPAEASKALKNFLGTCTHGVSRGVPIGPHSVHILSEIALNTIDESLSSNGYEFCRYVDDIHVFTKTREDAEIALYEMAEILDKQQKLVLQKHKTKIVSIEEFEKIVNSHLEDRPINQLEQKLLNVIGKHSKNDPYRLIKLSQLTEIELKTVDDSTLQSLIGVYLSQANTDYARLGWLLRRLAQIGAPGAIVPILNNLSKLTPIFGEVARYIMAASPNYKGDFLQLGELIISAIKLPVVHHSEYLYMVLLDLFVQIPDLNHINQITSLFKDAKPAIRREIVCAANATNNGSWLRERKDDFTNGDPWIRRAILNASPRFPGDESRHWIQKIKKSLSGLESIIVLSNFKSGSINLGNLKFF